MTDLENRKLFYNSTIPIDWNVERLRSCCLIKGEYGINAGAVEFSANLPIYLRITDIDDDGRYSVEKKVSVDADDSASYALETDDIVFVRTGATVGKSYLYDANDGRLIFAGFLIRFRPDRTKLLPDYLKYFTHTNTYRDWVTTVSMRSGQPGINADEYGSLKIPLPPMAEQKAIAHVLGLVDKAIELNNKIIAQKELRKKWLMQNLLTGKKRLKGFTAEWKTKKLGDLVKPISRPVDKPDEPFLAMGIKSHGKGTFLKPDFEPEKIDMDTLYVVRENDLIVNITFAWEGAIAIVGSKDDGALVSHRFPTFTFKDGQADVEYFKHFILQKRLKYLLGAISPGGAGRNRVLDKKDFLKLEFAIPEFDEQVKIGEIIGSAEKELSIRKLKVERLREQKRGMMQQLLTGKRRLKF